MASSPENVEQHTLCIPEGPFRDRRWKAGIALFALLRRMNVNTGSWTALEARSGLHPKETSVECAAFPARASHEPLKQNLGSITLVIGPIVDVKFEGELPPIY